MYIYTCNVRDFPQAKLNSEIKAVFLLSENGDLYILLHNSGVQVIFFKLENLAKDCSQGKNI